jgi:hypothetical protein
MHRNLVREHNECELKISVESGAVTSADTIVMVKSTAFWDLYKRCSCAVTSDPNILM